MPQTGIIKPRHLKPGDTIAVVSPAAPSPRDKLTKGKALLEARGFNVRLMPHAADSYHGYLAGTDEQRLADLVDAFQDPDVDAILCARGGFGCPRLLPHLPWDIVRQHPKLFMGFSDVTVLLNTFYDQCGLVGLYSPMVTSNLVQENQAFTWAQWDRLTGVEATTAPLELANQDPYQCFVPGMAEGRLMGGNLTLLTTLCGTPWQPDFKGAVVFIEDWKESFYKLDRQFTHLKQAGLLTHIAGLVLCDFSFCEDDAHDYDLTEQLRWLTADLGVPCGYGFTMGHGPQTGTLPIGIRARWVADTGQLTLLEPVLQ